MKTKSYSGRENNPICSFCNKFKSYCKIDGINENNCVNWLCNNGTCVKNIPVIIENEQTRKEVEVKENER